MDAWLFLFGASLVVLLMVARHVFGTPTGVANPLPFIILAGGEFLWACVSIWPVFGLVPSLPIRIRRLSYFL